MAKASCEVIAWDAFGHAEVFGSVTECADFYGCSTASVVKAIEKDDGRLIAHKENIQTPVAFLDWLYTGES